MEEDEEAKGLGVAGMLECGWLRLLVGGSVREGFGGGGAAVGVEDSRMRSRAVKISFEGGDVQSVAWCPLLLDSGGMA